MRACQCGSLNRADKVSYSGETALSAPSRNSVRSREDSYYRLPGVRLGQGRRPRRPGVIAAAAVAAIARQDLDSAAPAASLSPTVRGPRPRGPERPGTHLVTVSRPLGPF